MSEIYKNSLEAIEFLMVDSTDSKTGKAGLNPLPSVTIRKAGGSFNAPVGVVTEVGNGWYELTPTAADTDTLEGLLLSATAAGANDTDVHRRVVDPPALDGTVAKAANVATAAALASHDAAAAKDADTAKELTVAAIGSTTRNKVIPATGTWERPDSGTIDLQIELLIYDTDGKMEIPDATPTITIENDQGVDRSANLGTITNPTAGHYKVPYTLDVADAIEVLKIRWSYAEGGDTVIAVGSVHVLETTRDVFTTADRDKLNTLHGTRLTAQRATNLDRLDASVAGVDTKVADVQGRLPAGLSGTKMDCDVQAIAGDASAAVDFKTLIQTSTKGTVGASATTTTIPTNLTETTNDHYQDKVIIFTSGALLDQNADVTAYNGTSKTLTVTGLTEAPAAGDTFIMG